MKLKLLSIVVLIVAGVLVTISLVTSYVNQENQYDSYIASARINAEKEIPYNAYNCYKSAFSIHNDDEALYLEFLKQAELLGKGYYNRAVDDYLTLFPMSTNAYQIMCENQYNNANYKNVLKYALEARSKGIANERIKELYKLCEVMYVSFSGGYEEAQSFVGKYAKVKLKGKCGIINKNGKYIISPQYDELSAFVNNGASAYDGEKCFVVNSAGYVVARPDKDIDYLSALSGGKMVVSKNGKYGYTDSSLVIPEKLPYDFATIYRNNVAAVKKGGKWALINADGEEITGFIFDDVILDEYGACATNGIIFAKNGTQYYMYNVDGIKISQQGFDYACPFVENSLAAVRVGEKWGYVDPKGELVIQPKYTQAKSFSVGLAPVCVDGKWGYIDNTEKIRIACTFDDCKSFSEWGIAAVKVENNWSYIKLLPYDN